jgi:hypothetical protein
MYNFRLQLCVIHACQTIRDDICLSSSHRKPCGGGCIALIMCIFDTMSVVGSIRATVCHLQSFGSYPDPTAELPRMPLSRDAGVETHEMC